MSYKKDIQKVERANRKRRIEELDKKAVETHAQDNARGKLKIRSRTSGPLGRALNHKRDTRSSFYKANRKVNPMAQFGWTQEQYENYLKGKKD